MSRINQIIGTLLSIGAESNPLTRVIKKVLIGGVVSGSPLSALKTFLDVNGDGQVNLKDIRAISWDDILKVVVAIAAWIGFQWIARHILI